MTEEKKAGLFRRNLRSAVGLIKERYRNRFVQPPKRTSTTVVVQASSPTSGEVPSKKAFNETLFIYLLYLFFTWKPFPIFKMFFTRNIYYHILGFGTIYSFRKKNYVLTLFLAASLIVLPFAGTAGFFQALLDTGEIFGQDIQEQISFRSPFEGAQRWLWKTYGTFTNPDIVEQEPQKGVQVLAFATNEVFKEEKPVQIDAKVQIDGFYDPLTDQYERQTVSFSCYEESRDGKRVQEGEIYVDDEPKISITADEALKTTYVSCRFPQGMKIQTTDTPVAGTLFGVEEGTEVGNRIVTKKRVVLEAHTRMLQTTALKLWTVAKENAPEDITKAVNDPTLNSDGRSRPQCRKGCGGPYFVMLTTGVMPITEAKSPRFTVALVKNEQRFGTLERLNSIRFVLPQELALELGKTADGEPTTCDFDGGGALLADRLKTANQRISALVNFTSDEAPSLSLDFSCGYYVGKPLEKLGFHEVSVRTDYNSVIRRRGLVEVYRDKPLPGGENLA